MTPEQREYEEFLRTSKPASVWAALGGMTMIFLVVFAYIAGGVAVLVAVGVALAFFLDFTRISPVLVHGTLLLSAAIFIGVGAWTHANGPRPSRRLYRASDDIDG